MTWGGCDERRIGPGARGWGGGYGWRPLPPSTPRGENTCLAVFFLPGNPDAVHELIKAPPSGSPHQNSHSGRSRTYIIDTVVIKTARTQTTPTQRMPLPRVPVQAHTTTPHTQPSTQRTSDAAAGAGGPGLHQWLPHPRHRYRCFQGCPNTNRTHNSTSAHKCHWPAFPCKHTPRPRTHSRAHNVLQCLQLGQVDQGSTNGRRTRVTDIVVPKAARTQTAHTTAAQTHTIAPRSRASVHHDPAHTAGHTTYSSVRSWGR